MLRVKATIKNDKGETISGFVLGLQNGMERTLFAQLLHTPLDAIVKQDSGKIRVYFAEKKLGMDSITEALKKAKEKYDVYLMENYGLEIVDSNKTQIKGILGTQKGKYANKIRDLLVSYNCPSLPDAIFDESKLNW